jgi:hypothetical protein
MSRSTPCYATGERPSQDAKYLVRVDWTGLDLFPNASEAVPTERHVAATGSLA